MARDNELSLVAIEHSKNGLLSELKIKLVNDFPLVRHVVVSKDLFFRKEEQLVDVIDIESELTANSILQNSGALNHFYEETTTVVTSINLNLFHFLLFSYLQFSDGNTKPFLVL